MFYFKSFLNTSVGTTNAACSSAVRRLIVAALLVTSQLFSAQLQAAESDSDWEFMVAPLFLWGMSVEGESAIDGQVLALDLDFQDDVMENLDTVFTIHFEARKQDLLLFAEYQYVSLDPNVKASVGPVNVNADIDFTINMAELGAGYTVSETDATRWEILGGLRWIDHDLDATADVGGPGPIVTVPIEGGDGWYQGFVGARVYTSLTKNWRLIARGDYGYGDSDNESWHFNAMADYQFNDWGSAFIGYRFMRIDYETSSYTFDADQQGPMIGVSIYW